ncbi:MAG: hypothetical protein E7565_04970 [Ruminococcaceae bacterium]|nr:hypothetical protein [Oscillospiraceae bacterium]
MKKIISLLCVLSLIIGALIVPLNFGVSAAEPIRSVEIKDDEAFVFDFTDTASSTANTAEATGEAGIGYYGWGWSVKTYSDGNAVLEGKNVGGKTWSTGGGYRLHAKIGEDTYGFYALEPSTKYIVSFNIRVMSSPVAISGSKEGNTTTLKLGYNTSFDPQKSGLTTCYVNGIGTSYSIMSSVMDSNTYTLYDGKGKATEYPCDETWRNVTYMFDTPASFSKDNAFAFYNANFHGTHYEIDDVSITKVGANTGIIMLNDEYTGKQELKLGTIGETFVLPDISDRAQNVNHEFMGWFKDANRTEKAENVTFAAAVQTLYSAWKSPVNITFIDKVNGTTNTVTGISGEDFEYPNDPTYPTGEKWFTGWYTDENYSVKHTSGKFGYADLTLYAGFEGYEPFERMIDYSKYTVRKRGNSWSYTEDSPAYQSVVKDATATGGAYLNFHVDEGTAGAWLGSYTLTLTASGTYGSANDDNNVKFPENVTYKATVRMRINELSGRKGEFFVSYGVGFNNALNAAKNQSKILLSGVEETDGFEIFELYFTTPEAYVETSCLCFLGFTVGGSVELDYDIDYILLQKVVKAQFYTVEDGVTELREYEYYQPGESVEFPRVMAKEAYSGNDNTAVVYNSTVNAWYEDEALNNEITGQFKIRNNDKSFYSDAVTTVSDTANQIGFCGFDYYEEEIVGSGLKEDGNLAVDTTEYNTGSKSLKATGNGEFEIRNGYPLTMVDGTTYNITFSYKATKDSKISFGLGENYNLSENYALCEFDAKATEKWQTATVTFTADFSKADYKKRGYTLVGIIETNGEVYLDTIFVSSVVGGIGALKLKGDVANQLGSQAMRVMFAYKADAQADKILIDSKSETVVERGILIKDASSDVALLKENLGNGKVFGTSKNNAMDNCWSYNSVTENVIFSTYIKNFDIDDDRKISARGYIVLADGRVFYSNIISSCVKDITEGSGAEIEEGADIENKNGIETMNDYYFYLPEGTTINGNEFKVYCYDPFFKLQSSANPSFVSEYVVQQSAYVRLSAKGKLSDLNIYLPSDVAALIEKGSKEYLSCDMEALKMSENIKIVNEGAVNYVFVTDLHHSKWSGDNRNYMIRQMNTVVKFVNANDEIDFVIVGGDITTGMFSTKQDAIDSTQDVLNPLKECNKPVFIAFGNHDDNSYHVATGDKVYYPERIISDYDWNKNVLEVYCPENIVKDSKYADSKYYYYDIPDKKTRVIVLDSVDCRNKYDENGVISELDPLLPGDSVYSRHYKTGYSYWGYDIEQIKWLGNEAMTADKDWNYVYLSHMGIDGAMNAYGHQMYESKYVRDIFVAFQNKGVYTNENIGTFDYTDITGKIVVYNFGHTHTELVHYDKDIDMWQISTACANIGSYSSQGNITKPDEEIVRAGSLNTKSYAWTWHYRALGSPSENCFDVISADENKVVKFAFGGSGTDKTVYYKK